MALAAAARERGEKDLAGAIDGIIRDETYHATYTHTAVFSLAENATKARQVLKQVLRAEQKAYAQVMRCIFREFLKRGVKPRRLLNASRWNLMALLIKVGIAFPRLPLYNQIPKVLVKA